MKILEHVNLTTYSTFMADASARYFTVIESVEDMKELLVHPLWKSEPHYILGEGSNTLFASDYSGLIVKNEIKGLEVIGEDEETVTIKVGAGEHWNHCVAWTLDHGLWGMENLVLIPGTVGGAPVQNIGAYGVEVKESIHSVLALDTTDGTEKVMTNEACQFSYRNSIFKENNGRYFITHVVFVLRKKGTPVTHYERVGEELSRLGITEPTPAQVAEVVVGIRDSKLPRVGTLGTAGSFFKNPVVSKEQAELLLSQYPEMKQFPTSTGDVKLSAAWLLEYCGFKGTKQGAVGTYEQHALVLVSYEGARGEEVWSFAQHLIDTVQGEFGVTLEPEVNVISG